MDCSYFVIVKVLLLKTTTAATAFDDKMQNMLWQWLLFEEQDVVVV